ncbi:aspartate carbamoyltransferase [Methylomonas sp. MgM2]
MKKIALMTLGLAFVGFTTHAKETVSENVHADKLGVDQRVPYVVDQAVEGFAKTANGGVMQIVAKADADAEQIKLIQQYLRQTAAEYSQNDFSSTERFHGSDMPGLARMKTAKQGEIKYEYKALPNGAQIRFSTVSPQLLRALHDWIAAQIEEHGNADLSDYR